MLKQNLKKVKIVVSKLIDVCWLQKLLDRFCIRLRQKKKNNNNNDTLFVHQIQAGFSDQPCGTLLETTVGIVLTLISCG